MNGTPSTSDITNDAAIRKERAIDIKSTAIKYKCNNFCWFIAMIKFIFIEFNCESILMHDLIYILFSFYDGFYIILTKSKLEVRRKTVGPVTYHLQISGFSALKDDRTLI